MTAVKLPPATMAASSPRPVTVQRRRVERVNAILDAAEELLGEQGYEAATLKAIGERAGIPTASVYHYFADRHEVDIELMQRHRRELDERVAASLDKPKPRSLRKAVDAIIDPLLAYYREHPSVVELWFTGRRNAALGEVAHDWDETQAHQVWQLLVERQLLRADTPEVVLRLAFEAGDRLFDVAFRRSPTGDDAIIDEARRLITAYLGTYGR
jgi:AcrR family transcriptional regulator